MVPYFGDYPTSATVYIPINTFDSNDPAASVTVTNLANTDVHIHKDGGTTQRNNAAGITMSIDYDSITGNHLLTIDTSDNTVADFYQAGHEYQVRVEGITVDGGTLNAWVGCFSIERSGGALALLKNATYGIDKLMRTGADSDTGETLSDQMDALATSSALATVDGIVDTLLALMTNKRGIRKESATWYLYVRNAADDADILKKALKDKNGDEITDIAAGAIAAELASSV